MKNKETLEEVELAVLFHNTYERLAPSFGYETRVDTKLFDTTTPNGKLMIAVCKEVIKWQAENSYSKDEVNLMFDTLKENSIDNKVTITNIDLFISSWKDNLKKNSI